MIERALALSSTGEASLHLVNNDFVPANKTFILPRFNHRDSALRASFHT